jgi:hypothetical protein
MIKATMIADSVGMANGVRISTLSLVYPRIIHSEFMTHRVFSRNAASSRAIPVKKFLEEIKSNPAMPIYWGKNQKGMSAEEELNEDEKRMAELTILQLRDISMLYVEKLAEIGLHKQTANRYLEPWQHMATVVTSTEWANAKNLRIHLKAQPEFKALMSEMRDVLEQGTPTEMKLGEWHLPYVQPHERLLYPLHRLIKLSVARCARVSYKTHDGEIDPEKDMRRFEDLLLSGHMSPFEHQASPGHTMARFTGSGNFRGWFQYRKLIPGEDVFSEDEKSVAARRTFAEVEDPLRSER